MNKLRNFQLKKEEEEEACTTFTFLRLIIFYKFISMVFLIFWGEFSHLGDQRKNKSNATYMMTFVWRGGKKRPKEDFFLKSSHLDKRF